MSTLEVPEYIIRGLIRSESTNMTMALDAGVNHFSSLFSSKAKPFPGLLFDKTVIEKLGLTFFFKWKNLHVEMLRVANSHKTRNLKGKQIPSWIISI